MEEIWKLWNISNSYRYGKRVYEISNQGRLRINGVITEPHLHKTGYKYISGGWLMHRLVATLFIPNPDNKPCVDHINTIKTDNRASNLRWVTQQENCNNRITIQHKKSIKPYNTNRHKVWDDKGKNTYHYE